MTDDVRVIRQKIRQIVHNVTSVPLEQIRDGASLRGELDLDSLSLMEIGVDVDHEFKLGLAHEALQEIDSVDDAVRLVENCLEESQTTAAASEVA